LDFSSPSASSDERQVLYHYVTEHDFYSLAGKFESNLWSLLEDRHALFGRGVYCSVLEPAAYGAQEAVSAFVQAYCLDDWETNNFCIPIIAHRKDCLNLRQVQLPEMVHGPGKTVHGVSMRQGTDVWVLRPAGVEMAVRAVAHNAEDRFRMEVMRRRTKQGAEHLHVKQSMSRLVMCLKAQGKTAEADRVAAGSAADVSGPEPRRQEPRPSATRGENDDSDFAQPSRNALARGPVVNYAYEDDDDADFALERAAMMRNVPAAMQKVASAAAVPQSIAPPAASQRAMPSNLTSEAELARRFEPEAGAYHSSTASRVEDTRAVNIAGQDCQTLADLESEATSTGDPRGNFEEDSQEEREEISNIDKTLQWHSVARR
jgi:hypothetical protein